MLALSATAFPAIAQPVADPLAVVAGIAAGDGAPGACSAVLIGPAEALTAKHCVTDNDRLRSGLTVVTNEARRPVIGHRTAPARPAATTDRLAGLARDWAVLELGGTPARHWATFVGRGGLVLADALAEDGVARLSKVGFGTPVSVCRIMNSWADAALFTFRCGETAETVLGAGRSGSGLFVETTQGLALVAVHVAAADAPAPGLGLAVTPPLLHER